MTINISVKVYPSEPGSAKILFLGNLPKGTELVSGMNARLTFSDSRKRRRLTQNALYWIFINKHVVPAVREFDPTMSADEVHELFKNKFLGTIKIINGNAYKTVKSTTTESVSDFADYFNRCIEFAGSELGVMTELFHAEYGEIRRERS